MLLDFTAARAVARAHMLERAVNDPGPWSVRIGDREEPAVRIRTSLGVCFLALFDGGADPEDAVAWLVCAGEEVSARDVAPIREAFTIEWKLSLDDAELISA